MQTAYLEFISNIGVCPILLGISRKKIKITLVKRKTSKFSHFTNNLRNLPYSIGNQDCVVIGSYIYMVGGLRQFNSTYIDTLNTVYRAKILDPLAVPTASISITLNQSAPTSMPSGLFFYVVSANFPSNDPVDPNGESLPGVAATVNLPNISGLSVTVTWDSIPNAQSYNVYRTPTAGSSISNLQLLTTVTGNSFTDSNTIATNPSKTPLPSGSLGNFVVVSYALTQRWSLAVTSAQSSTNTNLYFLYLLLKVERVSNLL